MRKNVATQGPSEARWLMILPVAAMALGCDAQSAETAQEPLPATSTEQATQAASQPVAEQRDEQRELAEAPPNASAPVAEPAATEAEPAASQASDPPAASPKSKTPSADEPKAEAPSTRRGAAAKGEGFTVFLEGQSSHKLNQPSSVKLVLVADAPFKCNEQYPYRFTAASNAGVQYKEPVVRAMNIDKQMSTMTIPFTPSAAGSQTVSGELAFSVCTEDKCLIEKETVSLVIDVSGS